MTELKTYVDNESNTYEVTMSTDKKENYLLVQHLVRGLIDGKHCSVTLTNKSNSNVIYLIEAIEMESQE